MTAVCGMLSELAQNLPRWPRLRSTVPWEFHLHRRRKQALDSSSSRNMPYEERHPWNDSKACATCGPRAPKSQTLAALTRLELSQGSTRRCNHLNPRSGAQHLKPKLVCLAYEWRLRVILHNHGPCLISAALHLPQQASSDCQKGNGGGQLPARPPPGSQPCQSLLRHSLTCQPCAASPFRPGPGVLWCGRRASGLPDEACASLATNM